MTNRDIIVLQGAQAEIVGELGRLARRVQTNENGLDPKVQPVVESGASPASGLVPRQAGSDGLHIGSG